MTDEERRFERLLREDDLECQMRRDEPGERYSPRMTLLLAVALSLASWAGLAWLASLL